MSNPKLVKSFKADADIAKHTIVKVTSTGTATATADTDALLGVTLDLSAKTGEMADVVLDGIVTATASAAISVGAWVTATTDGKAVSTTTEGKVVIGQALSSAGADGDYFDLRLTSFVL